MRNGRSPKRANLPTSVGSNSGKIYNDVHDSAALVVKSHKDAINYSKDNFGIEYVDFEGIHLGLVNEINASLEILLERYAGTMTLSHLGSIQDRLARIFRSNPIEFAKTPELLEEVKKLQKGVIASTFYLDGNAFNGIAFNALKNSNYTTTAESLRGAVRRGEAAPGMDSAIGVTTHEFGHWLCKELILTGAYKAPFDEAGNSLESVVDKLFSKGGRWITENVSAYTAKRKSELISEAFAEYLCAPEPREAARAIGEAIDEAHAKMLRMK